LRRITFDAIESNDGLFVAIDDADLEYKKHFLQACNACGISTKELGPETAKTIEPALSSDVKQACTTNVHELGTDKVTLAPLEGFDQEGDLVVDMKNFFQDISEDWTYLKEAQSMESTRLPHGMRVVPLKELAWGGGIKGIFIGEHVFLLERIDKSSTKLIQKEDFSGLAIPFASLDAIEEGYSLMNRALKERAEALERN